MKAMCRSRLQRRALGVAAGVLSLAGLLSTGWGTLAVAQTPVYESKDKAGPVFSNQPSPGAKQIELPPPNVIQMPSPVPQQRAEVAAAPTYRSLVISSPPNQGAIHSNTGVFDVSVRVSPSLRTNAGDRFRLKLDGHLLPGSYRSSTLTLTEADWQAAARNDAEHTLQAAIVDKAGAMVIESEPVRFYVHRATAGGARQ
jgi:hypothetical protein